MHDGNFICIIFVWVSACMHCSLHTWIIIYVQSDTLSNGSLAINNVYIDFAENFWLVSESAFSPQTRQIMILHNKPGMHACIIKLARGTILHHVYS